MALTFRSSSPEERVLFARDKDGGERIVHAVQESASGKHWKLKLTHPSGMTWRGSFTGDANTLGVAMQQMMMDREMDYLSDKARGHKPPLPDRDLNVRVTDLGDDTVAPVTTVWSR